MQIRETDSVGIDHSRPMLSNRQPFPTEDSHTPCFNRGVRRRRDGGVDRGDVFSGVIALSKEPTRWALTPAGGLFARRAAVRRRHAEIRDRSWLHDVERVPLRTELV